MAEKHCARLSLIASTGGRKDFLKLPYQILWGVKWWLDEGDGAISRGRGYGFRLAPLQLQDLVVVAVGLHGVVELVQEFAAVARQEMDASDAAFLQPLVGIEGLAQRFR